MEPRKFRKIAVLFMLALFVSYKAGITMFTHAHIINGVMIVHSHPFSSDKEHDHSEGQLLILAQMQAAQYTMPEAPEALKCPCLTLDTPPIPASLPGVTGKVILWHSLRSPPHQTCI